MDLVTIGPRAHEPLLRRFYDEVYLPAFAHQREPLEAWLEQLWGAKPAAYQLSITLAMTGDVDGGVIDGGIVGELYPASQCAILTYMVVAPHARRAGLGRALLDGARRTQVARGARAVFAEVATDNHERIDRFMRWGGRILDGPYVQPDLGYGRDRALHLMAFFDSGDEPPSTIDGAVVAAFLGEFYAVTERRDPVADAELGPLLAAIPDQVALRRM
jgi:GNAT superfamily N-acetyltransferase